MKKPEPDGDVKRLFVLLIVVRRRFLGNGYGELPVFFIVTSTDVDPGGAGLGIPQAETGKIHSTCIFHGLDKILSGDSLSVKALEIKIHAFTEVIIAKDFKNHANHFGPFFVHGHGVEIIHFYV